MCVLAVSRSALIIHMGGQVHARVDSPGRIGLVVQLGKATEKGGSSCFEPICVAV